MTVKQSPYHKSSHPDEKEHYIDHNLSDLETIFKESMSEDADGLSMEEFRVAMKRATGNHLDDNQLDMMFMKVDTNCDGTVDWDEYLCYMLVECMEKDNMTSASNLSPFPYALKVVPRCNHVESITRIASLKTVSVRKNTVGDTSIVDNACERFVTLSRDGLLSMWSSDWIIQKTANLDARENGRATVYTDCITMSNCNCVAVASSSYEISIYSVTSGLIQRKFQIVDMDYSAVTMDFNFDHDDPQKSVLIWGDTNGTITVLRFSDFPNICLLMSSKANGNTMALSSLMKGSLRNVVCTTVENVHPGWVQTARVYRNLRKHICIVSGSITQNKSLHYMDVTSATFADRVNKQDISVSRRVSYNVPKGVLAVDYDPKWNLIVTGSRDCNVRIWNPVVPNRVHATLKGHVYAVSHVIIRREDRVIISCSKDKNVRIWDMRDFSCRQSIITRQINLGKLDISVLYMSSRSELILATNQIGIFMPRDSVYYGRNRGTIFSHHKPLTAVMYNPLFNQVVTCCEDSKVTVWDLNSGEKCMLFTCEKDVEITCMVFDPTYRRLATGLRNGSVKLWNFNNGQCLRTLKKLDEMEISCVVFNRHRILTAGWNKNVTSYKDTYDDETFRRFKRQHDDDIMSMSLHRKDGLLATASYDGYIYIWSLDTEDVIAILNMHESIFPIPVSFTASSSNSSTPRGKTPRASSEDQQAKRFDKWLPSYLPWIDEVDDVVDELDGSFSLEDVRENKYKQNRSQTGFKFTDKAVNKLLFLQNRRNSPNCAVLAAAVSRGRVVFWSFHQKGGLLGYFLATNSNQDVIISMDTDPNNTLLLIGDSKGFLKLWKIKDYCNERDVRRQRIRMSREHREYDESAQYFENGQFVQPTFEPIDVSPNLVFSVRAHLKAVTSVVLIEDKNLVLSGSVDCSVRLWTTSGRYIGTFGQKQNWDHKFPVREEFSLPPLVPEDVKKVASHNTLMTAKGTYGMQWKHVRHAVNFLGTAKAFGAPYTARRAQNESIVDPKAHMKMKIDPTSEIIEDNLKSCLITGHRDSVTVWVDDEPHCLPVSRQISKGIGFGEDDLNVEETYQRVIKNGIKSKHLGKLNYRPKVRHRESKIDTTVRWSKTAPSVFHSVPMSDLADIEAVKMPGCITTKKFNKQVTYLMARQKLGAGPSHLTGHHHSKKPLHFMPRRVSRPISPIVSARTSRVASPLALVDSPRRLSPSVSMRSICQSMSSIAT